MKRILPAASKEASVLRQLTIPGDKYFARLLQGGITHEMFTSKTTMSSLTIGWTGIFEGFQFFPEKRKRRRSRRELTEELVHKMKSPGRDRRSDVASSH